MMFTGLVMWFPEYLPGILVLFCYPLHVIGVAVLAGAVVVHIFLGTVANPGSVQSMLSGKCTRAWVELQHGSWLREYDRKQQR